MNNTRKLIVECYKAGEGMKQVNESVSELIAVPEGMMRVEGVVAVVDSLNRNKRKYPKNHYKKLIENLQSDIKSGLYGEMEHPNSMNINNNNVSHKVERVWLKEETGEVFATFLLLGEGTKGMIAQSIVRSGGSLRASSRGAGDMVGENVNLEVLRTYDLVGTPGFAESEMYKMESFNENNELIFETYVADLQQNATDASKQETKKNIIEENMQIDYKKLADELVKNEHFISNINEKFKENNELLISDISEYFEGKTPKVQVIKESHGVDENVIKDVVRTVFVDEISPVLEKWLISDFGKTMLESVQTWTVEEFAPQVEGWVTEEFAPNVEKWVTEEFAPNVEKWVTEDFAPNIEKWVTEEYSGGLQDWITTQFSDGIQKWVVEQYSPSLQNWLAESTQGGKMLIESVKEQDEDDEYEDEMGVASDDEMSDEVDNTDSEGEYEEVEESRKKGKKSKKEVNENFTASNEILRKISERLTTLSKPIVTQNNKQEVDIISETFNEKAPKYVRLMPESMKLQYVTLDAQSRDIINTKANMRDLRTEQQILEFWSTLDIKGIKTSGSFMPQRTREIIKESLEETQISTNSASLNNAFTFLKRLKN